MKNYYLKIKTLILSSTAKDTYVLFSGNIIVAFLGFLYTVVVARALSVSDFGIFSAAVNLVVILNSLTDLGISSGAVNFVAENLAKGDIKTSKKYIKASSVLRFGVTLTVSLLVIFVAKYVANTFLITYKTNISVLTALISLSLALPMLLPLILQAQKKFTLSVISDSSLYLSRLIFTFGFMLLAKVTIENSLLAFVLGGVVGTLFGIILIKPDFLKSKPEKEVYKKIIKFSGWLGVNRIISSISGRLDIQMLAIFAGATATGLYSIPSRLAGFVIVLASSFSGVLAPRLAGFNNKEKEKNYIIKATLALIPITAVLILWIIFARPFITILFGDKYIEAIPIFRGLVISMIPFIFTAPSVTAIIYSIKKTVYIGAFSFFQIVAIFVLNYLFIPIYGPIGPAITFLITNMILLVYSWAIVIHYYWSK